jgi:ankyrin repeat protein
MPPLLHQAARVGDLSELRKLLDQGEALECCEVQTGHTPLIAACLSPEAGVEVVEFLLSRGANVHACIHPKPEPLLEQLDPELQLEIDTEMAKLMDQMGVSAEMRQMIESSQKHAHDPSSHPPDPLISLAVTNSSCEKIQSLIHHGADLQYRSPHGYDLLIRAACRGHEDVIDLLLTAGAPVNGQSAHNESALSVLYENGCFTAMAKVLAHGADPASLKWTPLMRTIILGSVQEMEAELDRGADLEAVDSLQRTPLLLAIATGDTEKAALLLARGANRDAKSRSGKPPLHHAILHDHAVMLDWLIREGFDLTQTDEFQTTPLVVALEHSAVACFHRLLAAGADWTRPDPYGSPLLRNASHPEIIRSLIELGANPADLETDHLRKWIGLPTLVALPIEEPEFHANRTRRFGLANPEVMKIPFWRAMVRNGWNGYQAARHFNSESFGEPAVWCYQRFGMSLTPLPDGRFVQVAGEHEDGYDPDFCIYNDVIVHDGKGGFEIFAYPEDVFPPTDFHSATLVGEWIYLIGNLGYPEARLLFAEETPVFRLRVGTWQIERVNTRGPTPGWIHSHAAKHVDGRIQISGGKILIVDKAGESQIRDYTQSWSFDLTTARWQRIDDD